jgi:hypothetical protein
MTCWIVKVPGKIGQGKGSTIHVLADGDDHIEPTYSLKMFKMARAQNLIDSMLLIIPPQSLSCYVARSRMWAEVNQGIWANI